MRGRRAGRQAVGLRLAQDRRRAGALLPPPSAEAAAWRAEAARTWARATGSPPGLWLGPLEPNNRALIEAARAMLDGGATVESAAAGLLVLTAQDGRRMVLAADVLMEAKGSTR